ncbi:MAG TPA: hypothetical protein VN893_07560 [Bryobacteraceae bacterium]|nr:hypothetical protein [Bryobacteraceae bacterium]
MLVNVVEVYSFSPGYAGLAHARLTVDGPGGQLHGWSDRESGAASGVPSWTQIGDGVCLEVVSRMAPADSDPQECSCSWRREVTHVIDVSSLTQNGPLQLQVGMAVTAFGQYYTMSLQFAVFADVEFTLTQTPKGFRPEDARDDPATSNCSGAPGDNCRPSFTVKLKETTNGPYWPADLHVAYDFNLRHPAVIAGQPVTGWLKGSSTNSDGPLDAPDDANYADYVFDRQGDTQLGAPDPDGLHVATVQPIDYSSANGNSPGGEDQEVDVTVTSRDYGGSAVLRPTVTITGTGLVKAVTGEAKFNIVDDQGNDVKPPDPGCVAADDFVKRPYASLPVDQDCNGIADDWEQNYLYDISSNSQLCGGGPLTSLTGDEDNEPGPVDASGQRRCGDGLTVRDEYRGFHVYSEDGSGAWHKTWASLDPAKKQDVFFLADWNWPDGRPFADSISGPNAILARETPFIAYHRVQSDYAGALTANGRRGRINANSQGRNRAYAITYQDAGTSGTGVLADAQENQIDGLSPVLIYSGTITAKAANVGFPLEVLQDETAAHETGHRFGLYHPVRQGCCNAVPFQAKQLDTLTFTQFTTPPNDLRRLFALYRIYGYTNPVVASEDQVYLDTLGIPGVAIQAQQIHGHFRRPGYDQDSSAVYEIRLNVRLPALPAHLVIQNQRRFLMDWSPRLTMHDGAQWHFAPDDLDQIRVRLPQ